MALSFVDLFDGNVSPAAPDHSTPSAQPRSNFKLELVPANRPTENGQGTLPDCASETVTQLSDARHAQLASTSRCERDVA